ncbi:MAG: preprotein translocase subunit SecY [Victivallales bacterium]|nr:preprotein translocase subunit SecY [Victivallales bacterium]
MKIKELRSKILFTAGIIVLVRLAANIPCPGVDPIALKDYFNQFHQSSGGSGLVDMFDLFTGGALQHFAVATLGIMPYISASIIIQLLTPVLPSLEKMMREGDAGRQKINQYTRYLTVLICLVQGAVAATAMIDPTKINLPKPTASLVVDSGPFFLVMTVIIMTCGTMILVWLGEQITERGIGNGVSLIITIGIIARLPNALQQLIELARSGGGVTGMHFTSIHLLILFAVFGLVTAATILLTQGQRRVPIQMVHKGYGNIKAQTGTTYMPLKVNFAGVMPIIFASAILQVIEVVIRYFPFTRDWASVLQFGGTGYSIVYGIMIILFSFFWVSNQFNPMQISDNLKKEGAFIPGIRPGQPTADFLDTTMTKVTLAGSIMLLFLALFPTMLYSNFRLPFMVSSFFGGTSLLIIVGVVLDTLSQLESQLTMRNYEGFLKHGKIRSRRA